MNEMWRSVLALSFVAGAVLAAEVTLPVSVKFGEGLVTFSEDADVIRYKIDNQDGSSSTSRLFITGSDVARDDRTYSIDDCTSDDEACINFVTDNASMVFKKNLSTLSSTVGITSRSLSKAAGVCLELGNGVSWFGGPEAKYQLWPVENARWNYTAYYPKEDEAVAIAEPYWLNSEGTYLYVNPASSLFIDQNNLYDGELCLYSDHVSPYRERNETSLEVWIGNYGNPRLAHEAAVEKFFSKPTGIPDERIIAQPIWSTWARYKIYVNETVVRTYANEILENRFNHSQLEIDDFWETCYGSLTFDTSSSKFPDIKNLTDDLHNLGFRVTLWVHPFINADCTEYYEIARTNDYFAKDVNGSIFTTWWQGSNSSVIDFTNEAAVAWFSGRLTALQASAGIDSFKFDAGEASWMPEPAVVTGNIEESPGIYTTQFARALAEFGTGIEVRTGWQTQDLPIFVRMLDKDTSWTLNNGLPTLITTLLVMNIAGYGFVLPDMVGGNGYIDGVLVSTEFPTEELFVRWLQANTFMPTIQYSFVPWYYNDEIIEICRTYTDLHEQYAPTIIEAMNAAVANGSPVNAPVWWLDPTNSDAFNISDEYLLGEVILVAPVIVEGAVTRDIFLPSGSWVDPSSSSYTTYEGPTWIYDYPAPLEVLPYFVEANYWRSLGNPTSGASQKSFGLSMICVSTIIALVAKMFN